MDLAGTGSPLWKVWRESGGLHDRKMIAPHSHNCLKFHSGYPILFSRTNQNSGRQMARQEHSPEMRRIHLKLEGRKIIDLQLCRRIRIYVVEISKPSPTSWTPKKEDSETSCSLLWASSPWCLGLSFIQKSITQERKKVAEVKRKLLKNNKIGDYIFLHWIEDSVVKLCKEGKDSKVKRNAVKAM